MESVNKMIWILSIFLEICATSARASSVVSKNQGMTEVFSVVTGLAHLPCDLTPPKTTTPKDTPRLVLCYKNDDPQPIYSYDARFSTVKHWSEDRNFGPRSVFKTKNTNPAQLVISAVTMEDRGIYKCRVDFRNSPTVTTKIKLNIVEEPNIPMIMDNDGISVMRDIGPFRLRQPLILVCLVEGGNPKPEVSWWRDGMLWDKDQDPKTYEDVLQNTLVISQLDRTYHDSTFECRAINNNVTQPKRTSVTIRLEMPILQMTISNLPDPVTADVEYDLLCQVIGAQPLPTITWTLDNTELPSDPTKITHNNNMTSSGLKFTPKITDKGKVLTCNADNKLFPSVNNSQALNVYYIPIVNMEIINNVDPTNIREGGELVLRCRINAHPWVYRILWYRDGEELVTSENVQIDEQTLRLKHMNKKMSGQYVCSASNVEGDGFSKPLLIAVNYKPTCIAPTIQYKGRKAVDVDFDKNVTKEDKNSNNEELGIDLICEVDSKPKSSTYRWLFNSSQTRFEIPSGESKMSFNNYRPSSDQESGQVLCWASNDLGEQSDPCIFHVVPLSTPQPPSECEITNQTLSTVEVSCVPGFDGGLDQHFVIDVYETVNNSQVLIASNWTDDPTLYVWGLEPESNYIISVKAVNDRGESSPVYVGGSTGSGSPTSQYLPSIHEAKLPSLLLIIVGCLLTIMVIGSLITAIVAIKSRKRAKERMKSRLEKEQKPLVRQNGDHNNASLESNMKSIPHPNDLTEDQLAQFREAEALLEHADGMIQVQPRSPSISPTRERSNRSGSINRKVSFRNADLICTCGSYLRETNTGYTNGYHTYNSYNSIERRGPHERGASVPLLLNHNEATSVYPPVERAIVKSFSIDKMRPMCPTCNPSGDTPYPPDFPPIPTREAIEEETEDKKYVARYARSLSPTMNGMNDTKISDDSKSTFNTKSSKDDSSFSFNTDSLQNCSTSPLLGQERSKRSTSSPTSNKALVVETQNKIKGQSNNGISDQST